MAEIQNFWSYCAAQGTTSKKLALVHRAAPCAPLAVAAAEPVKRGGVIISVPYRAVLNCQTLRGGCVPRAVPPFSVARRFLTRRGRMDIIAAQGLWLAAFIAAQRLISVTGDRSPAEGLFSPVLNRTMLPDLPSLFTPQNAPSCPSVGEQSPERLRQWDHLTSNQVRLTHALLQFYARRRGIHKACVPTFHELVLAHRSVLQRSMLLPVDCEPSAPAELPDLLAEDPQLPLLVSLVPIVDLISPAPPTTAYSGASSSDAMEEDAANCSLYTCVQSDFLSATTRRRVVVETAPLESRRVVVCASKDIKEGQELHLGFE